MRALVLCMILATAGSATAGGGTPPVDPAARRAPELVEVTKLDPSIKLDLRYATTRNFTGRRLYEEARAFLERPVAEALVRVHRALAAEGLGLAVLDAYRPWRVTVALWD